MNPDISNFTRADLEEYAGKSGRALAYLHKGEIEEAIRLYEELERMMPFPVNLLMLSRSYAAAGRISEAITAIQRAVDLSQGDEQFIAEAVKLTKDAQELLIRFAISQLLQGASEDFCRELIRKNIQLVDKELLFTLHANTLAYAQRHDLKIMGALYAFAEKVAEQWSDDLTQAIILELKGIQYLCLGDIPQAVEYLISAIGRFKKTERKDLLAQCLNLWGMAAEQSGDFDGAINAFRTSIDYYSSVGDRQNSAFVLENLAALFMRRTDLPSAIELAKEAERQYLELGMAEMALKAKSLHGKCFAQMGLLDGALTILGEVIEQGRQLWSDSPILLADALLSKSYALEDMERLDEAQVVRNEAGEIYQAAGVNHLPERMPFQGGIAAKLNEFEEARQQQFELVQAFSKAGMILETAREKMNLASLNVDYLTTLVLPGSDPTDEELMYSVSLVNEADKLLDESISAFTDLKATTLLAHARQAKARLTAAWGMTNGDPKYVDQALDEINSLLTAVTIESDPIQVASLLQNKATLLAQVGRVEEARVLLEANLREEAHSKYQGILPSYYRILATLYESEGNLERAKEMYTKAIAYYEEVESRVGSQRSIIAWSKSRSSIFDEAIDFYLRLEEWETAYDLVRRSKSRTYCKSLENISINQPQTLEPTSLSELAEMLIPT